MIVKQKIFVCIYGYIGSKYSYMYCKGPRPPRDRGNDNSLGVEGGLLVTKMKYW